MIDHQLPPNEYAIGHILKHHEIYMTNFIQLRGSTGLKIT